MANTHGVAQTAHCACTNVDAYNYVGVAATDIDNGTFLALGAINNTNGAVNGYEFTVTVDANGASGIKYLAVTPDNGADLEMNLMSDPRYFYNKAGRPISIKQIVSGNFIRIEKNAFHAGSAPTDQPTYTTADIAADGKLGMVDGANGKFVLKGSEQVDVGQDLVTFWLLQYVG